jgi:hypothetical protein
VELNKIAQAHKGFEEGFLVGSRGNFHAPGVLPERFSHSLEMAAILMGGVPAAPVAESGLRNPEVFAARRVDQTASMTPCRWCAASAAQAILPARRGRVATKAAAVAQLAARSPRLSSFPECNSLAPGGRRVKGESVLTHRRPPI